MSPSTCGTSVIAVKFDGGVAIAADTLGSYGSLARFRNIERIFQVTDKAVIGCGGDIADYQFLKEIIEQKVRDDVVGGYTQQQDAGSMQSWLTRVMYNRRSKFDPLWLDCVVAGFNGKEVFLGSVDKIGTAYEADEVCTGLGHHMVTPLLRAMREKKNGSVSREDAEKALVEGIKVLFYRDCRAFNQYMMAVVTSEGVDMKPGLDIRRECDWTMIDHQ